MSDKDMTFATLDVSLADCPVWLEHLVPWLLSADFASSYGRQNFVGRKVRRSGFSAVAMREN
jgi:hypothetical protein